MNVLLVQPPFVQLNAPYPAVAYLRSFCTGRGHAVRSLDLSIELFRGLFSRAGLETAFAEARRRLPDRIASFDGPTRRNVLRYLSNQDRYVESIDRITGLLSEGDDSYAQELASARRVPYGHRAEGFLAANGEAIRAEDAPLLASLIVEDLADFLSFVLDPRFSLVRYAESIASSQPDFAAVEEAVRESWILEACFRPLVRRTLSALPAPDLVCVTVPFPGVLPGALAFCEEAKRIHGEGLPVAMGGGYVSTELRTLRDAGLFRYADYLCFDAGFGALASIESHLATGEEAFYRTIVRRGDRLVAHGFDGTDLAFFRSEPLYETRDPPNREILERTDGEAVRGVFPDFADLDFSRYVRIVEGTNRMHALWSGAKWLKARLAHGCYWRRCAFCDTGLDYIARFAPSVPEDLFDHLLEQARRTGQHGVHFVDEAMPVPHLLRFAMANLRRGRPLVFWGNARLGRRFTPDACSVLAEGGLLGVSVGLEVATERGLEATRKGLSLEEAVRALAALRGNGILAHAYLIYGWPGQAERDIVDSMETVRQLFLEGLLDSAFWHKFILTRHAPLYAEWKAGLHPGMRVVERDWRFGSNDLSFEGEERFSRYGAALDAALDAWMEGEELDRPVTRWFDGKVASPRIPAGFVAGMAETARRRMGKPDAGEGKALLWLGGRLLAEGAVATSAGTAPAEVEVCWSYRNRLERAALEAARARTLLEVLPSSATMEEFLTRMNACGGEPFEGTRLFRRLRRAGLAAVPPHSA